MVFAYKSLLHAGLFLSVALMLGRIAGFAREIMLASTFGLSARADVAIVLLTLPDLLVNLLLSGGLSVALVPALRNGSANFGSALIIQVSFITAILFGFLGLIFIFVPHLWVSIFAPGVTIPREFFEPWVLYAIAISLPLTALSGVSTAALNAHDRFFLAGCGTLIFNLCVISALWIAIYRPEQGLLLLSVGIFAGAVLRWLSQFFSLLGSKTTSFSSVRSEWKIGWPLLKIFCTGLMAVSLLIFIPVIIRALASLLGEGQLAAFNYAIKLVELPLGILIVTLATVAFPRLSELYAAKKNISFNETLYSTLRKAMVLSFAVVLFGYQYIDSVVSILFSNDRFIAKDQEHIVELAKIAFISVPWVGIGSLATASLNASQRPGAVLRNNVIALLLLPALCIPGLLGNSASVLMWALPIVHLFLAIVLCRAAGIHWLGACGWLNRSTWIALLLIAFVFFLSVLGSTLWSNSAEMWRIAHAIIGFTIASVVALYYLLQSQKKVTHQSMKS